MRVLLLSQHFWPESFAINQVAEDLVAQGCQVTVLTGKPNYPAGRIFEGYRRGGIQTEQRASYEIVRVPLIPRGRGRAASLMLNYMSFIASASMLGAWALRGRTFDVVFVYGTSPILQAIAALVIKWLKRVPVVTWVQDLWPESLQITGFISNRWLLSVVEAVVRRIYQGCDLLLVQSYGFLQPVRALAGRTPVVYHPNPGRAPAVGEALPTALCLRDGFHVVFAGNHGTVQSLSTVLDAAEVLGPDSDIRWVLVGSGVLTESLKEQVRMRGLERHVFLPGRFPPGEMPAIYEQADALLVALKKGEALSRTVPSKLQDYLSAGRPILAALDGEGAQIVRESRAGLCSPAEDAQALAAMAMSMRQLPEVDRAAMGDAGRAYFAAHFAPDRLAERLVEHFRGLNSPRADRTLPRRRAPP